MAPESDRAGDFLANEPPRRWNMRIGIGMVVGAVAIGAVLAQAAPAARGVATDIKASDVQALAKSMSKLPGGDELLKVTSINNGEYNVAVAVVHRAKAENIAASLEHNEITEVYYILSGSGMM